MPTNDERREVEARLRNYDSLRESFKESPICSFIDALGVGYLDWNGVCNRLADLIEPEPERTCHMKLRERGIIYDVFYFDCCGKEWVENRGDQAASKIIGDVCPYCGAKVVEQ